jgi:hypothetical protein
MKIEEKREKYSKYACHELDFFLYRKDAEFFKTVVLPYLRNKKDKTFLDHWLLNDDLTAYATPWAFEQLNVAERILMGQRLQAERARVPRHVADLWDLVPPQVDLLNQLFKTALAGSSLETGDALGLRKAMILAEDSELRSRAERAGGEASGAAAAGSQSRGCSSEGRTRCCLPRRGTASAPRSCRCVQLKPCLK